MKNKYKVLDDIVIIYLKRRNGDIIEAIIDKDDFEKVNSYKVSWYARYSVSTRSFYAKAGIYTGFVNGGSQYISLYIHRIVIGAELDEIVDHIDIDTLNNRKSNLRISKQKENLKHRKGKNSNNKSGYRNVCWIDGKWIVQLQINGKNTRIKSFDDVHEAGKFAEEKRKEIYGDYAGKG